MMHLICMIDSRDRKLLELLQRDADTPLSELAEYVNLSPSACSRRISHLREGGFITRTVAVLDRARMNVSATVFVMVKTSRHTADWLDRFRTGVTDIPEIVEVHRLAGNLDYILKIVVKDIGHYDAIYKQLVSRIDLFDVSAYISMETLKDDQAIPTHQAH
jgi:Lrp/AsnC family transcriptional regulator